MPIALHPAPVVAYAPARPHATLVASEPAAGSRLVSPPGRLRLVFSEPVEAALAHVTIVAGGRRASLPVAGDPRDVHALLARLSLGVAGAYRVEWHIVSADGHPIAGTFSFVVGAGATSDTIATTSDTVAASARSPSVTWGPAIAGAPVVPAVLRGFGVGCMMAAFGLLVFAVRGRNEPGVPVQRALLLLTAGGAVFLAAHLVVWLVHAAPDHEVSASWLGAAAGTVTAQTEFWRSGLALLALWALWLARRPGIALVLAFAALFASAVAGHSAAFHPAFAVPAKALHLAAAGVWLGGVVWLALHARGERERTFADARGVSSAALLGVTVVAVSGVVQTLLILPSPLEGWRTPYGIVILAKIAGLGVLIAFGAYHRQVMLPRLASDAGAVVPGFRRSLNREIAVFAIVILLGGLVAYIPPPGEPTSRQATLHDTPE